MEKQQEDRLDTSLCDVPVIFSPTFQPRQPLTEAEFSALVAAQVEHLRQAWADRLEDVHAGAPLLVAADLDGTLVDGHGRVSARLIAATEALVESGATLVLSTGRSVETTLPVAEILQMPPGYAVCSNGAVWGRLDLEATPAFRIETVHTFDPRQSVEKILAYIPQALIAVEDAGQGFRVTAPFPNGELRETRQVVSLEELCSRPVSRIVVRAPELDLEEFARRVHAAGLHTVEYAIGWTSWVDISPEGVTKAGALEEVRRALDIPRWATVSIGDGSNDIEMLRWAHCGVAMGGAAEKVVDAARWQTASVQEEGAAALFQALAQLR